MCIIESFSCNKETQDKVAKVCRLVFSKLPSFEKGVVQSGSLDCPVCGGTETLIYYRSGDTGLIGVSCITHNCVSWTE